jgi:hypothetical protein
MPDSDATADAADNDRGRLTIGVLKVILDELLAFGVPESAVLCADSDPEGNGFHPLRNSVSFGRLVDGYVHPEFVDLGEDETESDATAVVFGVGY